MATVADQPKQQERAKRIVGIVADAATLGCNRDHLRWVINGQRSSPGLLKRYEELKRSQQSTPPEASK